MLTATGYYIGKKEVISTCPYRPKDKTLVYETKNVGSNPATGTREKMQVRMLRVVDDAKAETTLA